ncbi:MAG: hypothetical protein KKB20_04240 [Proteobacteria bacterium]|nr:hypothetical protein [Pseudomonadota bacterium]
MTSFSTDTKAIRKFGLIALIFFGLLAGLGWWRDRTLVTVFFGCLATLGLGFVLLPEPLRPVYSGWLTAAHFIGRMLTLLMLALTFYLVITPFALGKRLFSGRPLPMAPDPEADSYWVPRGEPLQPRERFIKRF